MEITTRSYTISPEQFFKLSVVDYFTRQGWGYVAVAVLLIVITLLTGASAAQVLGLTVFALVLLVGYPVYRLRDYAFGSQSLVLRLPRRAEFDMNGVRFIAENGALDAVPWHLITRAEQGANYFLLYMGRQFHAIPHSAFQRPDDIDLIAALLKRQGLL